MARTKPSVRSRKAVYCVASRLPWGADFALKFGIAKDPWRRVAEMQTGNPLEMRVVAWLGPVESDVARDVESGLHQRMSNSRIRNSEWFDASHRMPNAIAAKMQELSESAEFDRWVWEGRFDAVAFECVNEEAEKELEGRR